MSQAKLAIEIPITLFDIGTGEIKICWKHIDSAGNVIASGCNNATSKDCSEDKCVFRFNVNGAGEKSSEVYKTRFWLEILTRSDSYQYTRKLSGPVEILKSEVGSDAFTVEFSTPIAKGY